MREALRFAGKMRLEMRGQELEDHIDDIISELGLESCQNVQIGSETCKRISGGERKRTSIACELITDSSLLVLDEPTSGLDSFKATGIVKILHRLAHKRGKTVVATIH